MKEKKGKKSLKDVENLVVKRSTRFKELSKSLSTTQFGTNSISISTTSDSDLPPNFYVINDGINICTLVGEYKTNNVDISNGGGNAYPITYYPSINLFSIGNDGWYCYSEKKNWSNISNIVGDVTRVTGYLFLFFSNKYNAGICSNCYRSVYNYPSLCVTIDSNQGTIFGVVISSIAQINALNRTFSQSGGIFLATTINNALNSDNPIIKDVITDIRRSTGETETTTPIFSPTINPITTFFSNVYFDIDLSNVNETSGDGNNLSAYKDFDISKLIKPKNFVNNMGSIEFTEFMLTSYTSGYNATFVLPRGSESTIIGSLDQLDNSNNSNGGLGFIRVRRDVFGFGPLFGQTTGSFMIEFTQPYFETQGQIFTSKRLSINFRVKFK
jgi:hypothetical protein